MSEGIKWYLAGPMTGIPQFNFPLFESTATELRRMGYDITSPVELDKDDDVYDKAIASPDGDLAKLGGTLTWGEFLARDVKLIADGLSGILLLPGWAESKGARLELFVALNCGYPVGVIRHTGEQVYVNHDLQHTVRSMLADTIDTETER